MEVKQINDKEYKIGETTMHLGNLEALHKFIENSTDNVPSTALKSGIEEILELNCNAVKNPADSCEGCVLNDFHEICEPLDCYETIFKLKENFITD